MSRGDGGHWEHVVHRAGTIALGVDRYEDKAERLQRLGDAIEHGEGQRAGKVVPRDLDPGQLAVVANANVEEAEGVQGFFGALNLAEVLGGDGPAVFDTRGEACAGGFVGQG